MSVYVSLLNEVCPGTDPEYRPKGVWLSVSWSRDWVLVVSSGSWS